MEAEENEEEIVKKKNAFMVMFQHEGQKTDCDFLRLFSYAQLAAEYEMKLVMCQRKRGIEGNAVLINLHSAACMMMEASKAYAHLHGNSAIEESCRRSLL